MEPRNQKRRRPKTASQGRGIATKKPTQQRSRETVDAICEAALRLIRKDGYEELSTRKIAETAGVSVGTVYQFFPNRESIVYALWERQLTRIVSAVQRYLFDEPGLTGRERLRAVTRGVGVMLGESTPEQLAFNRIMSSEGFLQERFQQWEILRKLVSAFLEAHRHEISVQNLHVASFIIVGMVASIGVFAVEMDPTLCQGESAADEIGNAAVRYVYGAD